MGRNSPHPLGLLRLNPQKALRTAAGTHYTPSACRPPSSSLLNSITALPPTLSSRVSRPQSPDAEVILDCDHSGITPRLVTVPCPVPAAPPPGPALPPRPPVEMQLFSKAGPRCGFPPGLLCLSPSVIAFHNLLHLCENHTLVPFLS